jgi:hypothetical protein
MDEQAERAAGALASVEEHRRRTRRAARLPWWVYAVMVVLVAAAGAVNDAVDLDGARLLAVVVLVALVGTLAVTFLVGGPAPLARLRGVGPRQAFRPRVFAVVALLGGLIVWAASTYGAGATQALAGALGLAAYPGTVAGVLLGVAWTGLFALGQALSAAAERREH